MPRRRPVTEAHAPDLSVLTGVRSGKRSYYREYRRSDERMQSAVRAMDSISRALVRTVEGPRGLLEEVARAAADHLDAEWTFLALADGHLAGARPRFIAIDAVGVAHIDAAELPAYVTEELLAVRAGRPRDAGDDWVRVPMTLEGDTVGELAAVHRLPEGPEQSDVSVLRILANQAAVSLHTSQQYQAGLALHRRAQQLYDEATAQAQDLAVRTAELRDAETRLHVARQREVIDAERHRIARELHDSVTQYVLSAGMAVEIARGEAEHLGSAGDGINDRLQTAKGLSQQAVEQLRRAIYALHQPHTDTVKTLPELLAEVLRHHSQSFETQLRVEGDVIPLAGRRAPRDRARGRRGALQRRGPRAGQPRHRPAAVPAEPDPGHRLGRRRRRPGRAGPAAAPVAGVVDRRAAPRAGQHRRADGRHGRDDRLPAGAPRRRPRRDATAPPTRRVQPAGAHRRSRIVGKELSPVATLTPAKYDERTDVVGIMLVDDHAIVRQGLRSILEREDDMRVVAEASSAAEAKAVVARSRPQIVLLDLKLSTSSDTEGLDLCADLTSAHPELGVLVLTTFLDENLVLRAVRAGARGYVVKDVDTSALIRAIRDVSRGESAFDARSASAMVRGLNQAETPSARRLTSRETEVLRLLARGMSNRDIGGRLYISETTAKFHVGNILRKLGVSRRAEAVYEASKMGLI